MAFIKAEKLKHKFVRRDEQGEVQDVTLALDDVNIEVEEGQFIAVLGHNGSGKSTFAKHLNALLTPSEGTVWVDGKDTAKDENILDIRKEAGMIFQNPDNQIVAGVVEEDVAFGPENIGVPTEEIWERVGHSLVMAASIVALKCLNLVPDLAAWMIPEGDTAFSTRNFGEGVAQQAKMSAQGTLAHVMH